MENKRNKGMLFKITIVWLATVLLGTLWLTQSGAGKQVCMTVLPETPRQGEPILVTFKLANPYPFSLTTGYDFYANGALLKQGQTSLSPFSAKTYQYAYASPVKIGERVNFVVKASNPQGNFEKSISAPPFPPQVCSSFISFASFSTSVMSSMSSMAYYSDNFAQANKGLNTGLVISLTLIALLIFLELAGSVSQENIGTSGGSAVLNKLKMKFGTLTWLLLIIFMSIVYTKVVMILSMG